MKQILQILLLCLSLPCFAGGYIAADSVYDEPVEHGFSYWMLLIWFCFWGWLSSQYAHKKEDKKANICAYICLGIPILIFALLFIRVIIIQILG